MYKTANELFAGLTDFLKDSGLKHHALITADKRYRSAGQRIDFRRDVEQRVLGYTSPILSYIRSGLLT